MAYGFDEKWWYPEIRLIMGLCNVNPGLTNHGLLIRGVLLQIVTIWYINGTLPIKQSRGLLIQGWHYTCFSFQCWCKIVHVWTNPTQSSTSGEAFPGIWLWTWKLGTPFLKKRLVGGIPTPWKIWISWDGWWNSQYMESHNSCSKPPTSNSIINSIINPIINPIINHH